MKRNLLLFAILLCAVNAFAQEDTLLAYNRWQDYFKRYTKEKYTAPKDVPAINGLFEYGKKYNCLVVYKDSTRAAVEFKMEFKGIEDLADSYKKLVGSGYKEGYYEIAKKDVKFFVFHDLTFIHDWDREFTKPRHWMDDWAILIIDGPIRYTQLITIHRNSTLASSNLGTLQKGKESMGGSDPKYLGGFNFKKWAVKTFADAPEILAKIEAGEKGFTKNDGYNIIKEYNEWVRKTDPEKFKSMMIFGYLIKGPVGE